MTLDALSVVKSLPGFQETITGVVPQFGGKCFDITLNNAESALRLAEAGFDYGDLRKPLRLFGPKYIHVSIFVSVEFPDDELLKLLKDHGQLKSDALCRLYFTEEGFRHIERGIRVAEFVSITKDLPQKVVTQGLEIFFKYSGQPTTCYRCHSTEHVVNECPKQRRVRPSMSRTTDETRGTAPLNNPLAPAWRLRKVRPRSKTPQLRSLPWTLLRHRRPQDRPLPKSRRLRSFFPRIHLSVDSRKRPLFPSQRRPGREKGLAHS